MARKRRILTKEIKDGVVRDYLRGDKSVVIQYEYKINPGTMYNILRTRQVKLRRDHPAPEERS